ncbi:MAG: hypothetical protein ACT4OO_08950 [Nitrospiraceae bacterium]
MHPLFSEGEIIFVNPDLTYKPGHYVVVGIQGGPFGSGHVTVAQETREPVHPSPT